MIKTNFIDIAEMINQYTSLSIKKMIVDKVVKRRKEIKISQKEMSKRSGVSYGQLKDLN